MYFNEIRSSFAEDYEEMIDGVVVAYPPDRPEIDRAWAVLNDAPLARRAEFIFPSSTSSKSGDFVSASQPGVMTSKNGATIWFREREDYVGPTSGYHFKQLLVNGKVAWEEDVAGGTNGWREVKVELPPITNNSNVEVTFRLMDKKGVGNFGMRWELAELRTEGLQLGASLAEPARWLLQRRGAFEAGFGESLSKARGRWHLPFVVMTAGQESEFRLRHGDPASPERRAEWLRMCMGALREGKCNGVVTYCLEKEPGSRMFNLAQKVFGEYEPGRKR
jgi:hypothetical protein